LAKDSEEHLSTHFAASQNSVRRAYFGTRTALTALNGTSVGGSDGNEERDDSGETHIGLRDVLWKGGISERLGREDTGGK
jgi:nicotinamide mononucleotide (NMN) deamidase PncC